MPKKRFTVEQIINHLRETDALLTQGQTVSEVCRRIGGVVMRYAIAFLFVAFAFPAHAETITGCASTIDGDTLEIRGQRSRLHGIDAPESGQSCSRRVRFGAAGKKAALALSDRIAGVLFPANERTWTATSALSASARRWRRA